MTMNKLLLRLFTLLSTLLVTASANVSGNSTLDNQINAILNWDGSGESLGLVPDVIAALAIIVGIIITFFGYKLIRPAVFFAGFIVGSVGALLIANNIFRNASYVVTACWFAFVVGGLIVGCLVLFLYKLGVFTVGALAGVLLATQIHTSFGYKIYPSNPNVVLIVICVFFALVFGLIAMKLERPFLIVSTACIGAIVTVWGFGYFVGDYPNSSNLKSEFIDGSWIYDIPSAWWGYLAGTLFVTSIGIYVQCHQICRASPQVCLASGQPVVYVQSATPLRGNPVRFV
jgi:hypothetical protein